MNAPTSAPATPERDLSWLLGGFTERVPGVANALLVSADGLPLASSAGLHEALTDQLAAAASGLQSLTAGAARCLEGGGVRQVLVEMDRGFLLTMALGEAGVLAVLATPQADLGLVGYEMTLLVARVGSALSPRMRGSR